MSTLETALREIYGPFGARPVGDIYIVPEHYRLQPGDPLTIKVILPRNLVPTYIRMDLAKVGWRRTEWTWQSGAKPQASKDSCLIRFDKVDLPQGVYEITQLGISTGDPAATHEILHFKVREGAFPSVYLSISEAPLPLISHSLLRDRVAAIEEQRRRYWFRGTLADSAAPGIGRFTACVLLTRCLLTSNLRLEDVDLIPLRAGLTGAEELMHLNQLLAELGFGPRIPLEGDWVQIKMRDFPLAAIRFRLIWASSFDQATRFVESLTSAILAVLSGHRMARGEVIATVVHKALMWSGRSTSQATRNTKGILWVGFSPEKIPVISNSNSQESESTLLWICLPRYILKR